MTIIAYGTIFRMIHVVGVILIRKDDAVLMQHRDDKPDIFYPDHWCWPGGAVEQNESFKDAAKRELLEETSYKVDQIFLLKEETYQRSDGKEVHRHVYWARYDDKQEIVCNEGQEMRFVKQDEFTGKQFILGQEELFKTAIETSRMSEAPSV